MQNGVQCFKATARGLSQLPNTNRPLGIAQTTPPTENLTLFVTSQVIFSEDGDQLLVGVKGELQQEVPGFLAVWNVSSDGSLSQTDTRFLAPSNTGEQNFGLTYVNGRKDVYVVAESTQGGIIYDFSNGKGSNPNVTNFPLPGQQITCWVQFSSKSNSYFMTDFGAQIVWEVAIDSTTLSVDILNKFQIPLTFALTDTFVGVLGQNQ